MHTKRILYILGSLILASFFIGLVYYSITSRSYTGEKEISSINLRNTQDGLTYNELLNLYSIDATATVDSYLINPSDQVYDIPTLTNLLNNADTAQNFESYEQFLSLCIDAIPVTDIYSYPGIAYEQLHVVQLRDARDTATKYNTHLTLEGKTTLADTRISDSDFYQLQFNLDTDAGMCDLVRMKIDRRNIQPTVETSALAITLLHPIVADRLKKYTHESVRITKNLDGKPYEEDITGLSVEIIQSKTSKPKCFEPSGTEIGFLVNVDVVSGEVAIGDYTKNEWPCMARSSAEL